MPNYIKDRVQPSLYQRIRKNSPNVWAVIARQRGGKVVTNTIGSVDVFTPQQARKIAKEVLAQLALGNRPIDERRRQERLRQVHSFTLQEAIEDYTKTVDWKPKTKLDALSTFKRRFGDWLNKPLGSITKADALRRFADIKKDVARLKKARDKYREEHGLKIKTYQNEIGLGEAQRAFRYLSAVFNMFTEEDIDGSLMLPHGNPCNYLKKRRVRKTLKPRERYLNGLERSKLYSFFATPYNPDYPIETNNDDADLIFLLIYTGLRSDEALSLKWTDVDFENREFTALNTKNHKDHTLPMTDATKDLFTNRFTLHGTKKYVFPSPVNKSRHMTASRVFARVSNQVGFDFTAHDLRRTVATVASELNYDMTSIGLVLNHSRGTVTSRYVQGDPERLRKILTDIQDALFPQAYT
jgi:hypothetical protein